MIPAAPDQFSKGWLERALGAPAGALAGFSFKPLGTGQMCDSFRLTLDWDGHDGPVTVIAKCPSHDEQSRNIAATLGSYAREVNWYRALADKSPVSRPHCYHAEIADNRIDFALLLGDCAPATQGDQLAGGDSAILAPAIIQLAALHAPFWNSDVAADYPWIANDSRALVETMLPALTEGFAARYANRLGSDIVALARALAANIGRYLDWNPSATSVVHGDFRLDNLLFSPGDGVIVVDWQTLGVGCPFADLAYLIGTSFADPADRAAQETALFDTYMTALYSHGVNGAPDDAWRDYRLYALSGVLMAIFASMNVERTERGDEMFAVMAERPARMALDWDSMALLTTKA
jgi:Phosphotransferase enzyme family